MLHLRQSPPKDPLEKSMFDLITDAPREGMDTLDCQTRRPLHLTIVSVSSAHLGPILSEGELLSLQHIYFARLTVGHPRPFPAVRSRYTDVCPESNRGRRHSQYSIQGIFCAFYALDISNLDNQLILCSLHQHYYLGRRSESYLPEAGFHHCPPQLPMKGGAAADIAALCVVLPRD